jgi:hypothetical protein
MDFIIYLNYNYTNMNIDVEIYLNQFVSFFEKNPDSLIELIGNLNKDDFFNKVREQCCLNIDKGEDVSLTKVQIIDIVVGLVRDEEKKIIVNTNNIFQSTSFGEICLN